MEPTIITYTGDGKTKTFGFGFSFFQPADIIVEINGEPARMQYALQIGKPNPTADMPYVGGDVCFAFAPGDGDEIKIYREFVLSRPVDYQATTKLKTHEMNQDSNFHLENIRDLRNRQKITDIILTEHDNKLSEHDRQIAKIIKIVTPDAGNTSVIPDTSTTPSVDLSEINERLTQIESNITTITSQLETYATQSSITQIQSSIAELDDRITNIPTPSLPDDMDYVVETQEPTSANNYTWYRKYASGWIEQGGIWNGNKSCESGREVSITVNLPIEMQDTNYCAGAMVSNIYLMHMGQVTNNTTIQFRFGAYCTTRTLSRFVWYACGVGA